MRVIKYEIKNRDFVKVRELFKELNQIKSLDQCQVLSEEALFEES